MEQTIKILGIAPYEGLKILMDRVAAERSDLTLDIFVGDMAEGLRIAYDNHYENYDVIISRGGTAELLAQAVDIPVIEIETSPYDILRGMKLAENYSGQYAIVGFPSIIRNVRLLCDLLQYKIDIYTWQKSDQVDLLLDTLRKKNYNMVLCDMITDTHARQHNLNSILITSGVESVESAIDQAVQISHSFKKLKDKYRFLKNILHHHHEEVAVFDPQGNCCMSTIQTLDPELLQPIFLKALSNPVGIKNELIRKELDCYLVSIQRQQISFHDQPYVVFYVSYHPFSASNKKNELFFYRREDVVNNFLVHFHGIPLLSSEKKLTTDDLSQLSAPLMFLGEVGTGKQQVAADIYCKSNLQERPFIVIDFSVISQKTATYLFSNINSPLHDNNQTFYFKGLEVLQKDQLQNLASDISDISLCRRNRVIFAYSTQPGERMPENAQLFAEQLTCILVTLPPLRERTAEISTLACLYMSTLNQELTKQAIGFTPDALELLTTYHWPRNLLQFRRVIRQIITLSQTPYIPKEIVQNVLDGEPHMNNQVPASVSNALAEQTLAEMNADIIRNVLEKYDGNQTKAAKSLGISRTTLWRMINR